MRRQSLREEALCRRDVLFDYTRGRIIDLSPRAADALDMKRAGVAAVVVEPLANQAAPTVAVFQTSGMAVAQ
jgi:rare lipoprotein A (peptidoglycan hydrolase)